MKVAEVVVRILEDEGIQVAFGIPGAAINPVYGYLKNSKIKHYVASHEEGAVHAADGYFRASGKLALAICTSGPGATNFVTGLYTAHADSIPLIAITGNANVTLFGKEAFQCVDIAEICKTVAKKTWCVTNPADVAEDHARSLPHGLQRTSRTGAHRPAAGRADDRYRLRSRQGQPAALDQAGS